MQVAIGLGANLGNKVANILNAIELTVSLLNFKELKLSSFYLSKALTLSGRAEEGNFFVNAALLAQVYQGPFELLAGLKHIERQLGRQTASLKWSHRQIDLDILLFNNMVFDSPKLTIPHLQMLNRDFVLTPLSQLLPEYKHPFAQHNLYFLSQQVEPKYVTDKLYI